MFETKSGKPWNSVEQRNFYNEKKKETFSGLEQFIGDPELKKIPIFNIFNNYKLWQKFDFKISPLINPLQLFLNQYNQFYEYINNLEFVLKSNLACGDIDKEQYNICMDEIYKRKYMMDCELNMKKKSNFNNIFKDENDKKEFICGLQVSILQRCKDLRSTHTETCENSPTTSVI